MWTILEELDPTMITTRANIPFEGIATNKQEADGLKGDDSKEKTFSPRRLRSWVDERLTYNGQLKILKARRKVVQKEADIPSNARVGSYYFNEADAQIYVVTGFQALYVVSGHRAPGATEVRRPTYYTTSYFATDQEGTTSLFDQLVEAVQEGLSQRSQGPQH
jgi:hypothetical protein